MTSRPVQIARLLAFVSLFTLFLAPMPARCEVVDAVAAVVDGEVITRSEVEAGLKQMPPNVDREAAKKEVLEFLIERKLVEKEAKKAGFTVTDDEVRSAMSRIFGLSKVSEDQIRGELSARGIRWEDYFNGVRSEIMRAKAFGYFMRGESKATDRTLKEFYLKNADLFIKPGTVRLLHLMAPLATPMEKLTQLKDAVAKGKDFTASAKSLLDAEPYDTGEMAPDSLKDPFLGAVAETAQGGTTRVISTPDGHNLLYVVEKKAQKLPPFEDIREEVISRFNREGEAELMRSWLDQLKAKAKIERK